MSPPSINPCQQLLTAGRALATYVGPLWTLLNTLPAFATPVVGGCSQLTPHMPDRIHSQPRWSRSGELWLSFRIWVNLGPRGTNTCSVTQLRHVVPEEMSELQVRLEGDC